MASTQELLLGEGAGGAAPTYIEDVFSTYLYTGTGLNVNKTITNGINLSTKGGLVWTKLRSTAGYSNVLCNTVSGFSNYLSSDYTGAQSWAGSLVTMTANSDGYTLNDTNGSWNKSGDTFVSWTFRKQPKFFDVVTYTGTGSTQDIAHNLGSTPGCVIIKKTSATDSWYVNHVGLWGYSPYYPNPYEILNSTGQIADNSTIFPVSPANSSTTFRVGTNAGVNASGATYVAYIFAHNSGGFGLAGTDNVISCGRYVGNGGSLSVTLGYEPQWLLVKTTKDSSTPGSQNWKIIDNMRGVPVSGSDQGLFANTSDAETGIGSCSFNATGFTVSNGYSENGAMSIYIAIRRGPMKVPTDGTTVFKPQDRTGTGSSTYVATSGFPTDTIFIKKTGGSGSSAPGFFWERLGPVGQAMTPTSTAAESTLYQILGFDAANNDGVRVGNTSNYWDAAGGPYLNFSFKRAPSFHDVVMYTGTGSATTFNHNLGVAPEMMIVKTRSNVDSWNVYHSGLGGANYYILLDSTAAQVNGAAGRWDSTAPTSTVFSVGTNGAVNGSARTYVNYLFATCAGVSKVGSFSGTGATQTINCGFTGGARFVLIKRIDSTGDWYVWNTSSGMVAGTDPYTLFNTNAASVNANNVYTTAVGFQIVGTGAGINASGGTYIYLAIA